MESNFSSVGFFLGQKSHESIKIINKRSIVGVIVAYVIIATLFDLFVAYNTSKNSKNKTRPDNTIELKDEKELKKESPSDSKKSKFHQILIDSSIYSNTIKLFDVSETKEQLNCLNGIRFFSLSWYFFKEIFIEKKNKIWK